MKKHCRLILLFLLCVFSIPALAELPHPLPGSPLFSNMADEASLTGVAEALIDGGLNADAVRSVAKWIADYNALSAGNPAYTVTSEFQPMPEGSVDYGTDEAYGDYNSQWWRVARREYWDVLCRSAAFYLLRDRLSVSAPLPRESWDTAGWLETDYNGIDTNPCLDLSDDEISAYFTLFQPIDIAVGSSADDMYRLILDTWAARSVTFSQDQATLITVWHQSGGRMAAGHAAVLVPLASGGCLLFEKYSPEYPYQATVFSSEAELVPYFESWMRLCYRGYTLPEPILILKNTQRLNEGE